MTIEVFPTASIQQEILAPASEYLLAKWKTLKQTGALTLQRLTEEGSYEIADNSIYMIETGGDFAFLYVGQNVQKEIGRNPTGQLLSMSASPLAFDLPVVYSRAITSDQPLMVRYTTMREDHCTLWQRLILPVRIGNITLLVCYSEVISSREDIFNYLVEVSPSALIVFYGTRNEAQRLDDGWILLANARARAMVDSEEVIAGRRLREFERFAADDFWVILRQAVAAAHPRAPAQHGDMAFEVIKFQHMIALRIPDQAVRHQS